MSINSITIDGGFTRDPEFKYAESGIAVWRGNLAHNGTRYNSQSRQQEVTTTYMLLVAFGYVAEKLNDEYLQQGDAVVIRGSLGNNTFEKRDGTKETKTQIEVSGFDVTRKKSARAATTSTYTPPAAQPAAQGGWGNQPAAAAQGGWGGNPNEEPPF